MEYRAGPGMCPGTGDAEPQPCPESAVNLALSSRGGDHFRVYSANFGGILYQEYNRGWVSPEWTGIVSAPTLRLAAGITWADVTGVRTDLYAALEDGDLWQLWLRED